MERLYNLLAQLLLSFLTFLKTLLRSDYRIAFKNISQFKTCDELLILGTGPSINTFLAKDFTPGDSIDVLCVNSFVRSDEYTLVKPQHYLLTAPNFWDSKDAPERREERIQFFELMSEITTWPMVLHVPALASNYKPWKEHIQKNKKITVNYFNNTPVEGLPQISSVFYNLGLGMPRPHNVLVGSVFFAIRARYKTIYLHGADHNWLEDLKVYPNNEVTLNQKHFYDKQFAEKSPHIKIGEQPMRRHDKPDARKLHEVLEKFMLTFSSYWELKRYAKEKGSQIFNLTLHSYIDAFDRFDDDAFVKQYTSTVTLGTK